MSTGVILPHARKWDFQVAERGESIVLRDVVCRDVASVHVELKLDQLSYHAYALNLTMR